MILYLFIIFISGLIIISLNLIFSLGYYGLTWQYIVLGVIIGIIFEYLIDLVISAIIFALPNKWFNANKKTFKVFGWERKFYENLGIKKWKDLIPIGKGPIGIGFRKDKISDTNNPQYLLKFLTESCKAETMHFISLFASFVIIAIFPIEYVWCISIPIAMVNFILQLLPVLVQRYIRPKLLVAFKRANRINKTEA